MTDKDDEELIRRIEEVRKDSGIPRMTKKDYITVAVLSLICLIGVILGGLL